MTVTEAYRVLGLDHRTNELEIERAYKIRIHTLQLLLVPGQPPARRQKAQQDLLTVTQAREMLMKQHGRFGSSCAGAPRKSSTAQKPTEPCPFYVIAIAFLIAASVTGGIAVVCFKSGAHKPNCNSDSKTGAGINCKVQIASNQPCDIEIDRKLIGQNSSVVDLNIREGVHRLVFRHRGTELNAMLNVTSGQTVRIEVDFEKRRVQVEQQNTNWRSVNGNYSRTVNFNLNTGTYSTGNIAVFHGCTAHLDVAVSIVADIV
jgi:hypothetical protein